jgi:hypothetical protein
MEKRIVKKPISNSWRVKGYFMSFEHTVISWMPFEMSLWMPLSVNELRGGFFVIRSVQMARLRDAFSKKMLSKIGHFEYLILLSGK